MRGRNCIATVLQFLLSNRTRSLLLMVAVPSGIAVLTLTLTLKSGAEQRMAGILDLFFHGEAGAVYYPNLMGLSGLHSESHLAVSKI